MMRPSRLPSPMERLRRRTAPPACARARARGAALITALFVVALAAILVSGLLWRQQVQIRRIENQRQLSQAQWVARGAIDWTRLILRSAADTSAVDYLGGAWAVPIAETRLSDLLGKFSPAAARLGQGTFLSGSVEDAQSKFNLRSLVGSPTPGELVLNVQQVQHLSALLSLLGLNPELAGATALRVRASLVEYAANLARAAHGTLAGAGEGNNSTGAFANRPGLADSGDNGDARPLQMISVDSLLDVPGFTPESVARLRPFVTVLPVPTKVNINTAPAEVLAAMVPGLDLSGARAIVGARDRTFFINISDFSNRLRAFSPVASPDSTQLDTRTQFFILHGRIRHERAELDTDALIFRDSLTHATRIISVRDAL